MLRHHCCLDSWGLCWCLINNLFEENVSWLTLKVAKHSQEMTVWREASWTRHLEFFSACLRKTQIYTYMKNLSWWRHVRQWWVALHTTHTHTYTLKFIQACESSRQVLTVYNSPQHIIIIFTPYTFVVCRVTHITLYTHYIAHWLALCVRYTYVHKCSGGTCLWNWDCELPTLIARHWPRR